MGELCQSCGKPVAREPLRDDAPRWLRDVVARTPVMCDDCIEEAERERAQQDAEREARDRAALVKSWRRASGIPERLRGLDLADPVYPDALEAAERWAAGETRGLLLTGPVGVGKTHMAAAAAWRRLDRGPLRWLFMPVLFAHLALDFANPLHEAAVGTLAGAGALVLDDLDKARPNEYGAEQVLAAVDGRVTAGGALAVTTNLRLDELAAKWPHPYGDAIVDRLASHCESFYLAGQSRRRLAAS